MAVIAQLGAVPVVQAATTTVNSTWCATEGGVWDSSTCYLTGTTAYTVNSGNALVIPSGTTLFTQDSVSIYVSSGGALTIDSGGTLEMINEGFGVTNVGTITNSGTIVIHTVSLSGIYDAIGSTFTNTGTIDIGNTLGRGIYNDGAGSAVATLTNSGTINITNSGPDWGLDDYGNITNSGTISVANTGASIGMSTGGILEPGYGTISNSGTITIANSADVYNGGTIDNYCSGVITGVVSGNAVTNLCPQPTISTSLSATTISVGQSVYDSAKLSGATSTAGGTVTYNLYPGSSCSGPPTLISIVTVADGIVPSSNFHTFSSAGSYSWKAVYSGDPSNKGATSQCESLTVVQPPTGNVPEFPFGLAVLFAVLIPLIAGLKKRGPATKARARSPGFAPSANRTEEP